MLLTTELEFAVVVVRMHESRVGGQMLYFIWKAQLCMVKEGQQWHTMLMALPGVAVSPSTCNETLLKQHNCSTIRYLADAQMQQ